MLERNQNSRKLNVLPNNPEKEREDQVVLTGRFPSWLHRRLPSGNKIKKTEAILANHRLPTVCEEANCPNLLECWSHKTATFLAMGKECTRNCGFCDIDFSKTPQPLQEDEPKRISQSVAALELRHVVITMVARDDLLDGGSLHLVKIIQQIREDHPNVTIEVLTSDFSGNCESWQRVLDAMPDVFNHNIETVRELTPSIRHKASYDRTLSLLKYLAEHRVSKQLKIKSGFMVGLGETGEQVYQTLRDLKEAGCDMITIGQYLQPNRRKLCVKSFVHPDKFLEYKKWADELGFSHVLSGPLVRSSYHAHIGINESRKIV